MVEVLEAAQGDRPGDRPGFLPPPAAVGEADGPALPAPPTLPALPRPAGTGSLLWPPAGGGPALLDRPLESGPNELTPVSRTEREVPEFLRVLTGAPLGFTGPSSVAPAETQADSHFVPAEDRWRIGFPRWDRYDKGHPPGDEYPYREGHRCDPYNLNVLKGDYPILGQHTFFELIGANDALFEPRQIPTATTPFESTARPMEREFFGRPNQFFFTDYVSLSIDLFHGDAAFKPADWRVHVTPVFNFNYLAAQELAVVNPDVRKGTTRARTFTTLQEWFVEAKIADLSPNYDFVSVRAGSQFFTSDFRGFIFSDTNRAVRVFGTLDSNRDQFNLALFDQLEKDTNSFLNTFSNRRQQILIANYYYQDFLFPGYTAEANLHYNHDEPSFKFDKNNFLVRPDPVGVFKPHQIDAVYFGFLGNGHVERFNITNAFYWAVGRDSLNPLANQPQSISAQMAAVELSYDRDWTRFRTSYFYSSGDGNPNNRHATGFDSILDNPNFAGGKFTYFQRQNVPLFGVNLTNRFSLIPDLRASKIQGQSNFVNPGLHLVNTGIDFDLTPNLKSINNVNFLWFDKTAVLEQFLFQGNIHRFIGADLSTGLEYRPLLINNAVTSAGIATLLPGQGFQDIYNRFRHRVNPLLSAFVQFTVAF